MTVTLNEQQKVARSYFALGLVGLIYVCYTYPITWAATYGSENAASFFGSDARFVSEGEERLFGFIRAQLLNLFLAFCPEVFLAIANFGSNATSMVGAGEIFCLFVIISNHACLLLPSPSKHRFSYNRIRCSSILLVVHGSLCASV